MAYELAEAMAEKLLDEVTRLEPQITRDLREIAEAEAGQVEGLDFRLKSPDSLTRKLKVKLETGTTDLRDLAASVKDVIRFTIVFHPTVYSQCVQDALLRFREKGYWILEEENTWQRGDLYSALHYTVLTPEALGHVPVEVQFHTKESYALKEYAHHKLYEEFRERSTPLARRQQLFDIMAANWDEVDLPDDVLAFPDEKVYLRPVASQGEAHMALDPDTDPDLQISPLGLMVHALLSEGTTTPQQVYAQMLAEGIDQPTAERVITEALRTEAVRARVRGREVEIVALTPDGLRLDTGEVVPGREVLYPTYHPNLGLRL
jgi:ppGpp synthetase/RelA/SpoT-type nucleotidyltranferase